MVVLRAILQKEESTKKQQVSAGYNTDISGEDTSVESTSVVGVIQSSNYTTPQPQGTIIATNNHQQNRNYVFNVDKYNNQPYWTTPSHHVLPSNYP